MKQITFSILILILLTAGIVNAQNERLSPEATVSLITCEPGDQAYSAFGHTAIRIQDPIYGTDYFFHWGVFNFDSPNFVWRFALGETDYEMGIVPVRYFFREYIERQSSVYEQVLNLTYEEKTAIYDALWENYKPENRIYRYNFVFDNCATRPYDLILNTCGERVLCKNNPVKTTFREVIYQFAKYGSPLSIGIDIVLGSHTDREIGMEEMIAFPMYTMKSLEDCNIITDLGTESFVSQTKIDVQGMERDFTKRVFTAESMINMFIPILVLLILMFTARRMRGVYKALSTILLITAALGGSVVFFLMFISEHPLVEANYNLMWLNPLQLILIPLLYIKPGKISGVISSIFALSALLFAVVLISGVQVMCLPLMMWWLVITYICVNLVMKNKSQLIGVAK